MSNSLQTNLQKNAGWFIAYAIIMTFFLCTLALLYSNSVSNLYKERFQGKLTAMKKTQAEQEGRKIFLAFVASHQEALRDAIDGKTPAYAMAQSLLTRIDPELILMLGATHNGQRDLMVTTKACSDKTACLQCLLLLMEAKPLSSLRIGLGPHPYHAKPVFPEYGSGRNCRHLNPEHMRYQLTSSPSGLTLTLFCNALLDQHLWSKNYCDFESTPAASYLPSDDFLDRELGEFLRKQITTIEIEGTVTPSFALAKPCLPAQAMREDVSKKIGSSLPLPPVSKRTYIFHSQDGEQTASKSTSSWYKDRQNWNYYIRNVYPAQRGATDAGR